MKAVAREALKEVLAEHRPMPTPTPSPPVTEIVIRSGAPESVFARGYSSLANDCCCPCPPPPCCCASVNESAALLIPANKNLLQQIQNKTRETSEELLHKLELRVKSRQLTEEIEKYAKEVGVELSK